MAQEREVRLIKEAEKIVLGCFLVKPEIFIEESEGLTPAHFQCYPLVADAYWSMIDNDKVPNTLTVAQQSDNTDVWDFWKQAHFDKLQDAKAVLLDHSVDKYIEEALERIKTNIKDRDAVLNETDKIIDAVNVGEEKDYSISKFATEIARDLIDNPDRKAMSGIRTPMPYLDQVLGGWIDTNLIIIAARPGMGKTAFAMQSAKEAAEQGYKVGVVSLEMSGHQLTTRLVTQITGKSQQDIDTRNMDAFEMDIVVSAYNKVCDLPIFIYDDPELNDIDTIYHRARKLAAQGDIDLLIIDYLQLIETKRSFQNDNSRIAFMSRRMKLLAKNADIPVLLLSQLTRSLEKRNNKRPILSDLRDSGAIEQDADIVLFNYLPSKYDEDDESPDEIIISKHRHGGTGTCECRFVGYRTMFKTLSEQEIEEKKPDYNPQEKPF